MSGRIQYEVWLMALSLVTGAWLMLAYDTLRYSVWSSGTAVSGWGWRILYIGCMRALLHSSFCMNRTTGYSGRTW